MVIPDVLNERANMVIRSFQNTIGGKRLRCAKGLPEKFLKGRPVAELEGSAPRGCNAQATPIAA